MSRFGTTATITWNTGNTLDLPGTTINLDEESMPQYPFTIKRITDRVTYTTKSGRDYSYQNYNKIEIDLNWSNLLETTRNELATMVNSNSIFSFQSGGNTLGTFRVDINSWNDTETTFERYDVSFTAREDA